MSTSPLPFNRPEYFAYAGSFAWALLISDYFRSIRPYRSSDATGEAMIVFGLWCLFLWWLSKRHSTGWNVYVFAIALATYAPFADHIDAVFGGMLGLSQ